MKAIISDLGNVIVNFENIIGSRAIHDLNPRLSIVEINRILWEGEEFNRYEAGQIRTDEFCSSLIRKLGLNVSHEEFSAIISGIFSLNEGMLSILKRLKKNHGLYLLSNTNEIDIRYIKKTYPEIFMFDGEIYSYEQGYKKPDKRIFQDMLKLCRALPEECLLIDDVEENLRSAKELGIHTIIYRTNPELKARLAEKGIIL